MSNLVSIVHGAIRWWVAPECRDQLFGPNGLLLEDWLQNGNASVVKQGPHQVVYRVSLPEMNIYLKHYRLYGVRSWLRQLIRPPKARMEYEKALRVAELKVPTALPLGLGESKTKPAPTDSFLITRSLEDTQPLNGFLETELPTLNPAERARIRQRLARNLGQLLACMHQAGLRHDDLHAGNLLVQFPSPDEPKLFLIDLHAARLGRPLNETESRNNLVLLNRYFILHASRSDRMRFWRAYCHSRCRKTGFGDNHSSAHPPVRRRPDFREQARTLEQATWLSNLRFWRARDRRSLFSNRYYQRIRRAGVVGHALRGIDPACLHELMNNPDAPFARPDIILLKDSRSSTVAEFQIPIEGQLRHVIYKRFRVTAWSDAWTTLVRRSAALRSWVFGHGLRERGLPTPRPLLVVHRRRLGLNYEGYLLAEKIPVAMELNKFVDKLSDLSPLDRQSTVRLHIDRVARLVRELHRRQVSHRDLKAANILISPERCSWSTVEKQTGMDGSINSAPSRFDGEVWLIDLVGVKVHHWLLHKRRVQNLARLHASFCEHSYISRSDKLRFLRTYLEWGWHGKGGWKRWWQQIEKATKAKIARNLRSGRPLA